MGDGEYNNLKYYAQIQETGEFVELGEPILLRIEETEKPPKKFLKSFTFYWSLVCNNYRKLHGMPMMRKKHVNNMRWQ